MTIPFSVPQPGLWASVAMIAAIVLTSTTGEVLTAAAMKSIGDLDEIRAHSGLKGAIRAVLTCPLFFAGVAFFGAGFLCAADGVESPACQPGRASVGLPHACYQCHCRQTLPQREC